LRSVIPDQGRKGAFFTLRLGRAIHADQRSRYRMKDREPFGSVCVFTTVHGIAILALVACFLALLAVIWIGLRIDGAYFLLEFLAELLAGLFWH
jgi:hypothetical protein